MKNVLFISRTFPPLSGIGSLRTAGFARLLPQFGWRPTVISVSSSSLPARRRDDSLLRFVPKSAEIVRVPDLASLTGTLARRAVGYSPTSQAQAFPTGASSKPKQPRKGTRIGRFGRYFGLPDLALAWTLAATVAGLRHLRGHHAIYSCGLPMGPHLAALVLAGISGKPWVCDFRDPYIWPGMRAFPTSVHERLGRWLERRVLSRATAVVTVGPGYARQLAATCPGIESKTTVIMNGYDGESAPAHPDNRGEALRLLHAGKIHSLAAVEALAAAVDKAVEQGVPIEVEMVGSLDSTQLAVIGGSRHPEVYSLTGHVPQSEAFDRMKQADALIAESCDCIAPIAIRAKIFEYLQLQKPVLGITDTDSAMGALIRDERLGRAVPPGHPDEIAAVLCGWQARKQSRASLLDPPLPEYAKFSRERSAGQLASLLDSFQEKYAGENGS